MHHFYNLDEKILYYGAFDCEVNALLYIAKQYSIPLNSIYRYNWSLHYLPQYDVVGGSVDLEILLKDLMVDKFNCQVSIFPLEDPPLNVFTIIFVDFADLPYSSQYIIEPYKHCIVAKFKKNRTVEVWDPFYKKQGIVSQDFILDSCLKNKEHITAIYPPRKLQDDFLSLYPFSVSLDYLEVCKQILPLAERLKEVGLNYSHYTQTFHIYYGLLRSISIARERCFQTFLYEDTYNSYRTKIITGWNKLVKQMTILSSPFLDSNNLPNLQITLETILKHESMFLDLIQPHA